MRIKKLVQTAIAGAVAGLALTASIAIVKLNVQPSPASLTPVVRVETHAYCYVEGCPRLRRTGDSYCTGHEVMGKVDRALRESLMYGIKQQHLRHGVVGASGYAFHYGPRISK